MFNSDSLLAAPFPDYLFTLAVFISIPVLAISAGFLIQWYSTKPVKTLNSAEDLMNEICVAHQIGRREQRLLLNIAELAGIANPATMAAIPDVFDAAVQSAEAKKPFRRSKTVRLQQLRHRLFGTPTG